MWQQNVYRRMAGTFVHAGYVQRAISSLDFHPPLFVFQGACVILALLSLPSQSCYLKMKGSKFQAESSRVDFSRSLCEFGCITLPLKGGLYLLRLSGSRDEKQGRGTKEFAQALQR